MGRKLTYEYVYNYFEEQGCELLETEYINDSILMRYICKCGNQNHIRFSNFRSGRRCRICGENQKHTFEDVKKYFKKNECVLLERKYTNANTRMEYLCSCGKRSKISFSDFKKGNRCKACGIDKRRKSRTLSYEYVKKYFKEQKCELLENEYINNSTKMRYKCNCGNVSEIDFSSFQQGGRCKKCCGKRSGDTKRLPFKYVKQYFEKQGCTLLEKEYKGCDTHMKYICECGNHSKIIFSSFKNGVRCRKCGLKKTSGKNNCNYNPNLTDKDRIDRRLIKGYNDWVKDVYRKDNYLCQKCFKKVRRLNAHHIEAYAENPNLRLDINNGITFCQKCHNKFHSTYGKKDISRKHLDMFLK